MVRLHTKPSENNAELDAIYDGVKKKLGVVPNMYKTMGNSPEILNAYIHLTDVAGKTSFSPQVRELISLIVSETNECAYCLAAHSTVAKILKVPEEEILMARQGDAIDSKTSACLKFAKSVVEKRGLVDDTEVDHLKNSGVTEKEIVELIFLINLNMFTNYFNHISAAEVDFPEAAKLENKGVAS